MCLYISLSWFEDETQYSDTVITYKLTVMQNADQQTGHTIGFDTYIINNIFTELFRIFGFGARKVLRELSV